MPLLGVGMFLSCYKGVRKKKGELKVGIRIIIVSHGSLAEGMLSAVEMIAGKQENISTYSLATYQTPSKVKEKVQEDLNNYKQDRFIILCDIKCGSIHNILVELCADERVKLISGMNLALVLSVAITPDMEKEKMLACMEEAKENLMYFDKETILNSQIEEDKLW